MSQRENKNNVRRSSRASVAAQAKDDNNDELSNNKEANEEKDERTIDEEWTLGWTKWTRYRGENGTSHVPYDYEDPDLVKWVKKQRDDYNNWKAGGTTFLSGDGFRMMDRMGFVWEDEENENNSDGKNGDKPIKEKESSSKQSKTTKAAKAKNKSDGAPSSTSDDDKKPKAVKSRKEPEAVKSSTAKATANPWDNYLADFQSFHRGARRTRRSNVVNAKPELIQWASEQKEQFIKFENGKRSKLTQDQFDKLKEAGIADFVVPEVKEANVSSPDNQKSGESTNETRRRNQKRKAAAPPPPSSAPSRSNKRRNTAEAGGSSPTTSARASKPRAATKKKPPGSYNQRYVRTEEYWDMQFNALLKFKKEQGHACVPKVYPENQRLSTWVYKQKHLMRNRKRNIEPMLTDDKLKRLEDAGFVFNTRRNQQFWHHMANNHLNDAWDENYEKLVKFTKENGNTLVPKIYPADQSLAYWVARQRRHYRLKQEGQLNLLSDLRYKKLEELGFVFNTKTHEIRSFCNSRRFDEQWENMFKMLLAFKKKHGHAIVPRRYKENQTLAAWTLRQRGQYRLKKQGKSNTLSDERLKRLTSVGFVFRIEGAGPNRQYFLEDEDDDDDEEEDTETEEGESDEEDDTPVQTKRATRSKPTTKTSRATKASSRAAKASNDQKPSTASSDARKARALKRSRR